MSNAAFENLVSKEALLNLTDDYFKNDKKECANNYFLHECFTENNSCVLESLYLKEKRACVKKE